MSITNPRISGQWAMPIPSAEILLLHADTIFKSGLTIVPKRAVKGKVYDFRTLVRDRNRLKPWTDPDDFDTDFLRTA